MSDSVSIDRADTRSESQRSSCIPQEGQARSVEPSSVDRGSVSEGPTGGLLGTGGETTIDRIFFCVACIPPTTTHHKKRIVKIGQFSRLADKPELVAAKAMLDSLLLPHQPAAPLTGPVSLRLEFAWPWLGKHSKKVRASKRIPHTSRPDCSNLAKTLEDRLVALRFMEDDNAVVDLQVRKWWSDEPGITVSITAASSAEGLVSC